jgi:hypothetical protein
LSETVKDIFISYIPPEEPSPELSLISTELSTFSCGYVFSKDINGILGERARTGEDSVLEFKYVCQCEITNKINTHLSGKLH